MAIYRVIWTSRSQGDLVGKVSATTPAFAWAAVQAAYPSTGSPSNEARILVSVTETTLAPGPLLVGS